ncbi:MAG: hypothetical protein R3Y64_10300 [Peptostreptococcaceae bacterium]
MQTKNKIQLDENTVQQINTKIEKMTIEELKEIAFKQLTLRARNNISRMNTYKKSK